MTPEAHKIVDEARELATEYCGCPMQHTATIKTPGKFEGEPVYTLYYWDTVVMSGFAENEYDCDCPTEICDCFGVARVDLDDHDREAFPDLDGYTAIYLRETDKGFVCHWLAM